MDMDAIRRKIETRQPNGIFRNELGAIDLASIMVGIIVIGLVGGVIAATVFAVIPWTQDKAAKQQLDSIVAAQSSYMGLSSAVPAAVPAGHPTNSYATSNHLASAGLLEENTNYCAMRMDGGKSYLAVALSGSGKYWSATDKNTQPTEINPMDVPEDCGLPYFDKTPTLTKFTYKCSSTKEVSTPIRDAEGTATWSDGITSSHSGDAITRTLQGNVEYKLTFDGTYSTFGAEDEYSPYAGADCLIGMDHWGAGTGVKDATRAFLGATSLVDVPEHFPSTISITDGMFNKASSFNDSDISKWDVSKVTSMSSMFEDASSFDQPLAEWDVSRVKDMSWLFAGSAFNQPLNSWDVSNVENMSGMLYKLQKFNHPLDEWDVSNVKDMSRMIEWTVAFDQPLNKWNVSNVENMAQMFWSAQAFNQPLNDWNVGRVTDMREMFAFTKFSQPLDEWNVSKVTNMSAMFKSASVFNEPLNSWNVSRVTDMDSMFHSASKFNQPLDKWNVSKVTKMGNMFIGANDFSADLSGWDTSSLMYGGSFANPGFSNSKLPPGISRG